LPAESGHREARLAVLKHVIVIVIVIVIVDLYKLIGWELSSHPVTAAVAAVRSRCCSCRLCRVAASHTLDA